MQIGNLMRWFSCLSGIVVVFLYTQLFQIGNFPATIGGFFAPIIFLLSSKKIDNSGFLISAGLFLLAWPIAVMFGSSFLGAELTPSPSRFSTSYALWAVSVIIITMAWITRAPVQIGWIFPAQVIIVLVMAVQFIGIRFFDNHIGYEIVARLYIMDILNSYLGLNDSVNARAIGTYYEPSMCARVMGTLCLIDMIRNNRIAVNLFFLVITLIFSQSFGLVLMVIVFGAILFGRSRNSLITALIIGAIFVPIASPLVESRSSFEEGSTYTRVIAPIESLKWSFENYPMGAPIGSLEILASITGFSRDTGESQTTNGIIEFLVYFGFIGALFLFVGISWAIFLFVSGEREICSAIIYLIISTGLSGSFLSIESSLLTYFFIVAAREARWSRREIRDAGAIEHQPRQIIEMMR